MKFTLPPQRELDAQVRAERLFQLANEATNPERKAYARVAIQQELLRPS